MDFSYCPKGWVPMTMEEKKIKEQQRTIKKHDTIHSIPLSTHEKQWNIVRQVIHAHNVTNKKSFIT